MDDLCRCKYIDNGACFQHVLPLPDFGGQISQQFASTTAGIFTHVEFWVSDARPPNEMS